MSIFFSLSFPIYRIGFALQFSSDQESFRLSQNKTIPRPVTWKNKRDQIISLFVTVSVFFFIMNYDLNAGILDPSNKYDLIEFVPLKLP